MTLQEAQGIIGDLYQRGTVGQDAQAKAAYDRLVQLVQSNPGAIQGTNVAPAIAQQFQQIASTAATDQPPTVITPGTKNVNPNPGAFSGPASVGGPSGLTPTVKGVVRPSVLPTQSAVTPPQGGMPGSSSTASNPNMAQLRSALLGALRPSPLQQQQSSPAQTQTAASTGQFFSPGFQRQATAARTPPPTPGMSSGNPGALKTQSAGSPDQSFVESTGNPGDVSATGAPGAKKMTLMNDQGYRVSLGEDQAAVINDYIQKQGFQPIDEQGQLIDVRNTPDGGMLFNGQPLNAFFGGQVTPEQQTALDNMGDLSGLPRPGGQITTPPPLPGSEGAGGGVTQGGPGTAGSGTGTTGAGGGNGGGPVPGGDPGGGTTPPGGGTGMLTPDSSWVNDFFQNPVPKMDGTRIEEPQSINGTFSPGFDQQYQQFMNDQQGRIGDIYNQGDWPDAVTSTGDMNAVPKVTAQTPQSFDALSFLLSGQGYDADTLAKMRASSTDTIANQGIARQSAGRIAANRAGLGTSGAAVGIADDIARQTAASQQEAQQAIDIENARQGMANRTTGAGMELQRQTSGAGMSNDAAIENARNFMQQMQQNVANTQQTNLTNYAGRQDRQMTRAGEQSSAARDAANTYQSGLIGKNIGAEQQNAQNRGTWATNQASLDQQRNLTNFNAGEGRYGQALGILGGLAGSPNPGPYYQGGNATAGLYQPTSTAGSVLGGIGQSFLNNAIKKPQQVGA